MLTHMHILEPLPSPLNMTTVLVISLSRYLRGEPVSSIIAQNWSKHPQEQSARFSTTGFDFDANDIPTALKDLKAKIHAQEWGGVMVGWCLRGNPDRTALFEQVVSAMATQDQSGSPATEAVKYPNTEDQNEAVKFHWWPYGHWERKHGKFDVWGVGYYPNVIESPFIADIDTVRKAFIMADEKLHAAGFRDWSCVSKVITYHPYDALQAPQVELAQAALAHYMPHNEPEWITCTLGDPVPIGLAIKLEIPVVAKEDNA
ncbi:hypothetical protein PISL3812_03991 [Talaromyces islandicus]|uniref:Uncharacterized protein n=1 Tax=Talaromyces islandicus TaxID=28573 RepID=A0A0U1LU92_TALIS|nr:hypothetical protein PISL3812_03991 [Talaromyces islandicus]